MNAITLDEAQQDLAGLVSRILADAEPTILSTSSGEAVVLLPLDEFNSWRETAYLLSNPANAAHLRRSIAEARAGQVVEHNLIEP
jgi:antitoxin YefM